MRRVLTPSERNELSAHTAVTHATAPVTNGLLIRLLGRAMLRKLKKENGSPGRARTADLVMLN